MRKISCIFNYTLLFIDLPSIYPLCPALTTVPAAPRATVEQPPCLGPVLTSPLVHCQRFLSLVQQLHSIFSTATQHHSPPAVHIKHVSYKQNCIKRFNGKLQVAFSTLYSIVCIVNKAAKSTTSKTSYDIFLKLIYKGKLITTNKKLMLKMKIYITC